MLGGPGWVSFTVIYNMPQAVPFFVFLIVCQEGSKEKRAAQKLVVRWGEAVLSHLASLCLASSFRASFFFSLCLTDIRKIVTAHSKNLQPMFNWFSFTNKGKHMPGQSMLVLYPASVVFLHGKAFSWNTSLSFPTCLKSQLRNLLFLQNSNCKSPSVPLGFKSKEPPSLALRHL